VLIVVDTNILVSAFINPLGAPAKFIWTLYTGENKICYNIDILNEYQQVLFRPKFKFDKDKMTVLLSSITKDGLMAIPAPMDIEFIDDSDRKFYEVAKHCNVKLLTGNLKHYPKDPDVISLKQFFESNKSEKLC
jgi:uncharacterized protein